MVRVETKLLGSSLRGRGGGRWPVGLWLMWGVAMCLGAGCSSVGPTPYVAPRIEGRILDVLSRQPVVNALVRRVGADEASRTYEIPKGGALMQEGAVVRTAADGSFLLSSERDLAPFRKIGWYATEISVSHPEYERFSARYTLRDATNTPAGEPLIRADIFLKPKRH